MNLTPTEAEFFYSVWMPLLQWVNQQRQVDPTLDLTTPQGLDPERVAAVRDVLWSDASLLDSFVATNPSALSPDALALTASWRHRRVGTFIVYRQLQKHAVVFEQATPSVVYAVLGINTPPGEMVGWLPIMVQGVLIPFGDRIIFDGLLRSYPIHLGPGIRRGLANDYREARGGLVHSLGPAPKPGAAKRTRSPRSKTAAKPMKPLQHPGRCEGCGGVFSRRTVARHLDGCESLAALPKGATSAQALRLAVESPGLRDYWLYLDVPIDLTLTRLDAFLRGIWLECCGHLSAFTVDGTRYSTHSISDGWGGPPERSLRTKVASLGDTPAWKYEYDFGSTTELRVLPLGLHPAPAGKVRLIARNLPPTVPCSECGAPATKVCSACSWDEGCGWLCAKCARKHGCGSEQLLPVVNSPRTGVCGYVG